MTQDAHTHSAMNRPTTCKQDRSQVASKVFNKNVDKIIKNYSRGEKHPVFILLTVPQDPPMNWMGSCSTFL